VTESEEVLDASTAFTLDIGLKLRKESFFHIEFFNNRLHNQIARGELV
jgi:hypothetical protein